MKHKNGKAGGYLVGKKHSQGGIPIVNTDNPSQKIEAEDGEVIITAPAVKDNKVRVLKGTNRQILSQINQSGGGVSFAKGGEIPKSIKCSGRRYEYGGKIMTDYDIVKSCGCKHSGKKMATGGNIDDSNEWDISESLFKKEGNAIAKKLNSPEGYEILDSDPEIVNTTWSSGGCYPFARAMQQIFGGKLVFIWDRGIAQHVMLNVGKLYLDSDGVSSIDKKIKTAKQEGLPNPVLKEFDIKNIGAIGVGGENLVNKIVQFATSTKMFDGGPLPTNDELIKEVAKLKYPAKHFFHDYTKNPEAFLAFIQDQATGMNASRTSVHAPESAYKDLVKLIGDEELILRCVAALPEETKQMIRKAWKGKGVPLQLRQAISARKFEYGGMFQEERKTLTLKVPEGISNNSAFYQTFKRGGYFDKGGTIYARGGNIGKSKGKKDEKEIGIVEFTKMVGKIKAFVPQFQINHLTQLFRSEEKQAAIDIITHLIETIDKLPSTYQTEKQSANEKIVYLHYFYGGSDWYIVEKDKGDPSDLVPGAQHQAFGYAILNGDLIDAEWGYISIEEIKDINSIELDFYFTPLPFGELKKKWQDPEEEQTDEEPEEEGPQYGFVGGSNNSLDLVKFSSFKAARKTLDEFQVANLLAQYEPVQVYPDDATDKLPAGYYLSKYAAVGKTHTDKATYLNRGTFESNLNILHGSKESAKSEMEYEGTQQIPTTGNTSIQSGNLPTYRQANAKEKKIIVEKFGQDLLPAVEQVLGDVLEVNPFKSRVRRGGEFGDPDTTFMVIGASAAQNGFFYVMTDEGKIYLYDNFSLFPAKEETQNTETSNIQSSQQSTIKPTKQIEINNQVRELIKAKGIDPLKYSAQELSLLKLYEGAGAEKGSSTDVRILDQFFTPMDICAKMWGMAIKHGFKFPGSSICEPAVGSGRFLSFIPPDSGAYVRAYDVDETAYSICKILYPGFDIRHKSFETEFFKGHRHIGLTGVTKFFDLVIGNPPYREYVSEYAPLGEKKDTGAFTFEMYFIARGIDVLVPGGLLVYIIPNTFLSNDNKYNEFKEKLSKKCELIDAYRLPNGVFSNTEVGTDIIALRKK